MPVSLPNNYRLVIPEKEETYEYAPIWHHVEDIACHTDIGVETYNYQIAGILFSKDQEPVGASWYQVHAGEFDYHIAVIPEHQNKTLGSFLLDLVIKEFNKEKENTPSLEMNAFVINTTLARAMYRRGFHSYDILNKNDEFAYKMTQAPSFSDFLNESQDSSSEKLFSALQQDGKSVACYLSEISDFFNSPKEIPRALADNYLNTINNLPLECQDIDYLATQIHLHCPELDNDFNLKIKPDEDQPQLEENTPPHHTPVLHKRRGLGV